MSVGYDISASASTSSSAATGANTFAPVTITNLGSSGLLVVGLILLLWYFVSKKN